MEAMNKQRIQVYTDAETNQRKADLIASLRQLREDIIADRGGALIDLDSLFDDLHDERDEEFFGDVDLICHDLPSFPSIAGSVAVHHREPLHTWMCRSHKIRPISDTS